jgi:site-specific recombinase XerD
MARARKRAADLEDPKRQPMRTLAEAIAAFDANCVSNGFKASSLRRYRNNLSQFRVYCEFHGIIDLAEIDTSTIDAFRAARKLGPLTGLKELEVLRQFLKFCLVRHWIPDNPASQVRGRGIFRKTMLSRTHRQRL